MAGEIQVGRIFKIPIKVHWTLLVFLPILSYLVAIQIENIAELPFVDVDPNVLATDRARLIGGFVVAVGLFVSVLLHELGHAVVALRQGIGVKQITLWIFGGIAHLDGITQDPKAELKVAIAGPIVSLALGAMPAAFLLFDPGGIAVFLVGYLAYLNVVLAIFNMVPAFPLDGGRVLRALLAMRMPFGEATRKAAAIGKGLAVLMGLAGVLVNIWLVFIALFIYMGASQEAQGVELFDALSQVAVREIMDGHVPSVQADTHLDDLVPLMLGSRTTGFPVVDGDTVVGIVTLTDLQEVSEDQRSLTRVRDVMTKDLATVTPDAEAAEALKTMMDRDIGRLLVIEDERLVGVVTRAGIMQAFQILKVVPKVEVHEIPDRHELDRHDDPHLSR